MRILFLSINYWPEQTGIGAVNTWRCEYLASHGHDVTMCTSFPYYPEWRVAEGYRGRLLQRELHNGVKILRSWMWVPRAPSASKRILFEASFLASSLARASTRGRPDLLYIVSPPLGLGLSAVILSRWWRIPYVFEVMDLQPDAAADLGMLREGRLVRTLYALERMAYRNASLVTTLTEGMRQRIVGKGILQEKVKLFPARADRRLFGLRDAEDGRQFRRKHGLEEQFLVLHSGAMGVKQGLDVVLEAAKIIQSASTIGGGKPRITFLLTGDGAARPGLQRKSAEIGLSNVKFLPVQPPDVFPQMLAASDVALVSQQRSVSDIVFPSKTVTYLASGSPVIASVNRESEIARVIDRSGAGVVVAPENPEALIKAVEMLRLNPDCLAKMSEAGTRYAREHWDGARILPQMEEELIRIAAGQE